MANERAAEPGPDNLTAGTAPMPLRVIEEFINTRRRDGDEIGTPRQLAEWLHARGLIPVDTVLNAEQRDRAERIREGLRALIAENNTEPVSSPRPDGLNPTARVELAELTRDFPLMLDVTVSPPRLVACARVPVEAALARLLAVVAEAVVEGTWTRLKACREPSCRWAYYDHSRNRRRTWCSMDLCGNRAKARASHHRKSTAP
ncbi:MULTISPECIES: CGNR zinc finger domain-containing protein [Thermomonosporaceae]|uniref:CGNR zinc finger domain-containing protein n=1 Tax=Thermomonosporaceae TaxID=2012 RepID=UPI00255B2704|nr:MULTISPECIES: CGNR zinc finger domain-containing protein [Thermomonosporaceae]MDL4775797.1 CGNR zinc finger domain-containing protein [Actinomadura xylanilytica]